MANPVSVTEPVAGDGAGAPKCPFPSTTSSNHANTDNPTTAESDQSGSPRQSVRGIDVTALTQCAHWHSERDIIAIRHKCCGEYFACISCHEALAKHDPAVWPKEERHAKAVLCGNCQRELTIAEYLASGNVCPGCHAGFNPGCSRHYDLYFEMD